MTATEEKVKSGKEILDEFFTELPQIEGVNPKIAVALKELYESGKFTDTNVKNALDSLKESSVK